MLAKITLVVSTAVFLMCVRCIDDSEGRPIQKRASGGTAGAQGGREGTLGSAGESGAGGEFGSAGDGGPGGAFGEGGASGSRGEGGTGAASGAAGAGGAGGSAGYGGAAGGGGTCPNQRPNDNERCIGVPPLTQCSYGQNQCTCFSGPFGGGWDCFDCPAQRPQNGSTCGGAPGQQGERCSYGSTQCACLGGTWSCGDCPSTAPDENTLCESAGLACRFGTQFCFCGGGPSGPPNWSCFGGGGTPDGSPFGGIGGAPDDGGNAGCPVSEPLNNSLCGGVAPGTQCNYGNRQCRCFGGSWRC